MSKKLVFNSEVRKKIKAGVDTVANAVKVSLGPKGRHVAFQERWGMPTITNDGVSIAKQVDLEDDFENMAANLVKEVASKTNDVTGDGTTSATVLAQALISNGIKQIEAGANPIYLKNGIELATRLVVEQIKAVSKPISTKKEMKEIATISANDSGIGEFIADAMHKVGKDGVVTIEESKYDEISLEMVEGMQFDRGFLSPYFITDPVKMISSYDDAFVLILDQKMQSIQEVLEILSPISQKGERLLIITQGIDNETLNIMVRNRLQGVKVVIANTPGYGDRRKEQLQDIAILVGGTVIGNDTSVSLNQINSENYETYLGKAKRIIVTKENTTIVSNQTTKKEVALRIKEIEEQIKNTVSDFDIDNLKERRAKLTGGVAVLNVGDKTESAMKTKKFKIEDALHATKAALNEGVVPGGGVTLLKCEIDFPADLHEDEILGVKIVLDALGAPAKQICVNAGKQPDVIINEILLNPNKNYGYDAKTEKFVDLIKAGIVDPTLTVRTALENASSIACLLLTTDVFIAIEKDDKKLEE